MRRKGFVSICLLLILSLATGCASYPGGETPPRSYSEITPYETRPSVDYQTFFTASGIRGDIGTPVVREEVEKVFRKSGFFKDFSVGKGKEDYHLDIHVLTEEDPEVSVFKRFITFLTLFIVPSRSREYYLLTVDVIKKDEVLKRYSYRDHVDTRYHILLAPKSSRNLPMDAAREVIDAMLLNFLYDLGRDRVIAP